MKIDRYTTLLLTVIAVALVVIAVRPSLSPVPSYAARSVEYKLMKFVEDPQKMEVLLNKLGKEGWDMAGIFQDGFVAMKR